MKKFKNIYLEITNQCNLNCYFCPSSNLHLKDMMTYEDFIYYYDKIKDYTEGIYLHILGEPLLNKDIFKMIAYSSKNTKVSLTTNGLLLKKYRKELLESNLYIINLSLQSIYQLNIEQREDYFLNLKEFISLKKNSLAVHLRIWNDKDKNKELNDYLLSKIKEYNLLDNPNVNLSFDDEFEWPKEDEGLILGSCLGGKRQLAVHTDGKVSLCCLDYDKKAIIGDLKINNLEEILVSDTYKKVLQGWIDRKPYFNLCQNCNYKNRFRR